MRSLKMRSLMMLGTAAAIGLVASRAEAATITGTLTGPDGAAVRGAFVQARNAKSRVVVSVLSDNAGRYRIDNLPAGEYRLQIRAPGLRSDPRNGLNLTAE